MVYIQHRRHTVLQHIEEALLLMLRLYSNLQDILFHPFTIPFILIFVNENTSLSFTYRTFYIYSRYKLTAILHLLCLKADLEGWLYQYDEPYKMHTHAFVKANKSLITSLSLYLVHSQCPPWTSIAPTPRNTKKYTPSLPRCLKTHFEL